MPDELPSDPAELRAFAAALLERCARLERLLKLAKDAQFGRSSEKLDGVSAEHWLSDVLAKLVNGWPAARLDELLPWSSTYTMHAHDPRLAA